MKNLDIAVFFAFLLLGPIIGLGCRAMGKSSREAPRAVQSLTDDQYRAFSRDFKAEDYR